MLPDQHGWLVPTEGGGLCLLRVVDPLVKSKDGQRLPAAIDPVCVDRSMAERGRLMATLSLTTVPRRRVPTAVFGVVPDGVRRVVVRTDDGRRRVVVVSRNGYEATVTNPVSLSFVLGQGEDRHRYSIPTPSVAGGSPQPLSGSR